mmetsp:Transcript_15917/g.33617  ORF Transcript_15917/g.33617 Transcript_15917/m.33617 type:complete len:238 (-) Transcript_15917:276-989(-)
MASQISDLHSDFTLSQWYLSWCRNRSPKSRIAGGKVVIKSDTPSLALFISTFSNSTSSRMVESAFLATSTAHWTSSLELRMAWYSCIDSSIFSAADRATLSANSIHLLISSSLFVKWWHRVWTISIIDFSRPLRRPHSLMLSTRCSSMPFERPNSYVLLSMGRRSLSSFKPDSAVGVGLLHASSVIAFEKVSDLDELLVQLVPLVPFSLPLVLSPLSLRRADFALDFDALYLSFAVL